MEKVNEPKCPCCKTLATLAIKNWTYSIYQVQFYHCNNCGSNFKAYYYDGKFSHIILNVPLSRRIVTYLKSHDRADEIEISKALGFSIEEVVNALSKLEKKGLVDKVATINQ